MFLCDDIVLLRALANICIRHAAIRQGGRHRSAVYHHRYSYDISDFRAKYLDDCGKSTLITRNSLPVIYILCAYFFISSIYGVLMAIDANMM